MGSTSRFHVLLISRAPGQHRALLRSFRGQGAQVFVASHAERALALLRVRPELVLVDFAFGAHLNPAVVRALNRRGRSTLVIALHDGHLEAADEYATHLSVQGFCRATDLTAGTSGSAGAAVPASFAMH